MERTPRTGASTENRLGGEHSPYLLQHARNPVHWYPWGAEAFEAARREQKPILLSIGYSTCHWCHVMAHESFEDPEIAQLMNRWFVNIKVDREEHPDVDQVYMSAVQLLTGRGGWPLTVFLTPDLKPFFGGTYFPPERHGELAGMKELLPAVAQAWAGRREELLTSADQLTASIQDHLVKAARPGAITVDSLHAAFNHAAAAFDPVSGGFGEAPKFPRGHELSFLLRYWDRTGTQQALEMVQTTLDHLARGGIHDHLGGGFHRYATDARWLVPHFEKMLYDQALLAVAYLEAYRATGQPRYAEVARGIFEYVLRDLTAPEGGFYSAEDADSEGEEGKCYVWTPDEVIHVLGSDEGELFNRFYGVTPEGNFEGSSILNVEQPLEAFAALKGLEAEGLRRRLAAGRERLLAARSLRVRPHRDDKILTSWNGLMIAAFAYGGATLDEPRYLRAAERAAEFIATRLLRDGRLLRRYRNGHVQYPGTLEDYAFFSHGLLELYQAGFDPRWLRQAAELAEQMMAAFWNDAESAFVLRAADDIPLIVRSTELYDGATPSGGSLAVLVLLRVGRLTADQRMEASARRALERVAQLVEQAPFGFPQLLCAWDTALGPSQEIVVAGDPAAPATRALIRVLHERFLPRALAVLHPEGADGAAIESLAPSVASQRALSGRPTAYVCERFVCQLPVTSVEALRERLARQ